MKYLKIILFLSILCFFNIQCAKDDDCQAHDDLTDMQNQPIFLGSLPQYGGAFFNPNNSDEFIFNQLDGVNEGFGLIKYNLKTKERTKIFQGYYFNRARWGKDGWILLNIKDGFAYDIYKIRDDGTELTQLTNTGNCFYPNWDITSDKFCYQFAFTTPTKYILSDKNGSFIDTIGCCGSSVGSWQHPEYMAGAGGGGVTIYNPIDCEVFYDYHIEYLAQSFNGAVWLDEENVFWCHTNGIYRTNITTKETKRIRETCNAHCYQRPTYAPDIDKIIIEKLERIKDTKTSGRVIVTLVMMNPDGTEEEVLELD